MVERAEPRAQRVRRGVTLLLVLLVLVEKPAASAGRAHSAADRASGESEHGSESGGAGCGATRAPVV